MQAFFANPAVSWTLLTTGGILLVVIWVLLSLAFLLLADRKIDLLTFGGRQGARGLRLRRAGLHLNQAHPAVAGDGQTFVIAEARDLFPGQLRDLQNRHAGFELDLDAIDLGDCHSCYSAAISLAPCTCRRPLR